MSDKKAMLLSREVFVEIPSQSTGLPRHHALLQSYHCCIVICAVAI